MTLDISAATAVQVLLQAFAPLRCAAETFDYDRFVRFRVFDANDEPLLRMDKLTPTDYGSGRSLETIINHARSRLVHRGLALAPWQMPDATQGAA